MKFLTAFIRPEQLTPVKQALFAKGIYGMSVTNILGCGQQKGFTETYRGVVMEVNLLKKIRLEIALPDDQVDVALDAIQTGAYTGREGDGMMFVQDIVKGRRVRTGEEI